MIGTSPIVGVVLATGATFVPVLRARAAAARREALVVASVPETVDLLRLAVAAGQSVHQVIDTVASRAPAPFADALAEVGRRVRLGARLGDAVDALHRTGDAAHPLAAALRSTAFDGVALGPALERVAADARLQRRRAAEIAARRLPVQLLLPLVVCVLPAFGLLAVAPLIVVSLQSLHL